MVLAAVWGAARDRKLMLAVMAIFVFGNFAQLSRDLGGHNHKVFNLWEILMNVFAAFAFVRLWNVAREDVNLLGFRLRGRDLSLLARAAVPVVFLLLVISGIIDFMTIKNDGQFLVFGDKEPTIDWIEKNTPGDSVPRRLRASFTPRLPGRPRLPGYRPLGRQRRLRRAKREAIVSQVYGAQAQRQACGLLQKNGIEYVQVGPGSATTAVSSR
jgi:hypothetical protein